MMSASGTGAADRFAWAVRTDRSDAGEVLARGRALGVTPWLAASIVSIALLCLADRYGYHRDELYFRIAGRHLAFGYVDQPPITPLIARIEGAIFGDSPLALRVWPALVAGAVVVLAAVLCREFGGGRRAQAFTAIALAASPGLLLAGHSLSTETTDLLIWQVIALLAVRALRTDRLWLWLAVGAVVGIGLQNKDLPAFLAVALLAGLVANRRWEVLGSRQLWLGVALALLIAAPALIWQARHGYPQWAVAQAQRHGTGIAKYVLLQLIIINPALIPAQVRGLRMLWNRARYRPLVWAFALLEIFFLFSGGKPYYPAPILVLLAAAGMAVTPALRDDQATATTQATARRRLGIRYATLVLFGLVLLPAVLPVLPEATFASSPYAAQDDARATIGWPQLAAQVDAVIAQLPATGRAHAVVLTHSYGAAGALDRFGRSHVTVVSGHNSLWYYRRPPVDAAPVVVIGYATPDLAVWFTRCRTVTTLHMPHDLDNQDNGAPVSLCATTRLPWSALWPQIRHSD
jgi:4-amino-4-deoxy-L-arabinose transferase-like glycosyltransferase